MIDEKEHFKRLFIYKHWLCYFNQINAIVIMNEHRRQLSNMRIYLHDNESQFSTQSYNEELLFLKKNRVIGL